MKVFKNICVGALVLVCSLTLAGCFQGTAGATGRPGDQGESGASVEWKEFLDYMWVNVVDQSKYEDIDDFYVRYVDEYLQGSSPNVQSAANLAVQSAVDIIAVVKRNNEEYAQGGAGVIYKLEEDTEGSEDKYTGNGYIITNYHVVSRSFTTGNLRMAAYAVVYLYSTPHIGLPARVLGGSAEHDIAVLELIGSESCVDVGYTTNKVILTDRGETVADILNSSPVAAVYPSSVPSRLEPALGTQVLAVGNPGGYGMSVTDGIISVQSEYLNMTSLDNSKLQSFRVMRISAAINPGNSGGGLFNTYGELVGIVQARTFYVSDDDLPADNMAYAIPLDIAFRIAEQTIERKGEYVAATSLSQATTIKFTKTTYGSFAVESTYCWGEYIDGEVVIKEVVSVKTAGTTGLTVGDEIVSITIGDNTYDVTRVYHVDDILLGAYGKTVTFNVA